VTAVVHNAGRAREIDAATRRAWSAYSDSLRGLTGEDYERVEPESWSKLQGELRRLDRRRRTVSQTGS
jgi:hypothetical protein